MPWWSIFHIRWNVTPLLLKTCFEVDISQVFSRFVVVPRNCAAGIINMHYSWTHNALNDDILIPPWSFTCLTNSNGKIFWNVKLSDCWEPKELTTASLNLHVSIILCFSTVNWKDLCWKWMPVKYNNYATAYSQPFLRTPNSNQWQNKHKTKNSANGTQIQSCMSFGSAQTLVTSKILTVCVTSE